MTEKNDDMDAREFYDREYKWIARLTDEDTWRGPDDCTTPPDWAEWCAHYRALPEREQALCGYALVAARKDALAESYVSPYPPMPVNVVAHDEVNGGYGIMFAFERDCFAADRPRLFYVRSDMCAQTGADAASPPAWIARLCDELRAHSSGFADFDIEVMRFDFDGVPCDCYAITFRMSPYTVRERIVMPDRQWRTADVGRYILTLGDITGEYGYCIGELTAEGQVCLWHAEMDFD